MVIVGFLAIVVAIIVIYLVGVALFWLLSAAVTGLIVGALGRLIVPGSQPIGLFATIVCGWGGAFVGSAIGRLAGLHHGLATLGVEVLTAAVAVGVWSTRSRRRIQHTSTPHRVIDI